MVSFLVISICVACLTISFTHSAAVVEKMPRVKSKLPSIDQLQVQGQTYLSRKKYKSASFCFSAILQLAQGSLIPEQLQSRRRSGLQLAQCEHELGHDHSAIARCCDVINETPDMNPSFKESEEYSFREEHELKNLSMDEQIAHDLGRAYFQRGVCLKRIGQLQMALEDFESALHYLPDEIQIHTELSTIQMNSVPELTTHTSSHTTPHTPSHITTTNTATNTDTNKSLFDSQSEQKVDFLDECVLQYPSIVFTSKQLKHLVKKNNINIRQLHTHNVHNTHNIHNTNDANIRTNDLMSQFDMSSLFGNSVGSGVGSTSVGGNSGSIGSGVGDIGGVSGNGGGVGGVGGNSISSAINKLISFIPLICSLTGMPQSTTNTIVHTLTTISNIYTRIHNMYSVVRTYSDTIVVVLVVIWLTATLRSYRHL